MSEVEQVLEEMIKHYERVMFDNLPNGQLDKHDLEYIQEASEDLKAITRTLRVYRECIKEMLEKE